MSQKAIYIDVNQIKANMHQPRLEFKDETLQELALSIKENGLIQPITVREKGQHYEIIAGERRFRACLLAGFKEILCFVMDSSDLESAQMALVENIQREDLTAIEQAKAYDKLIHETGMKQEELAKKMGKAQSTIANKLRLLQLPDNIQEAISTRQITERHGRALLNASKEEVQQMYETIVAKGMNVKQTEHYIESAKEKKTTPKRSVKGFSKNIRIGINTIQQAVTMCNKIGIAATSEVEETDEEVSIVVKFKK